MKNKKVALIIGFILFLFFLLFVIIRQKRLSNNGVLLQAHTLNWASSAKMGMSLRYEFYFNNERKTGDNSFAKIRWLRDFENRDFPVMYDSVLGSSQLLVEPSDFERFNIAFPDSLNWVREYTK